MININLIQLAMMLLMGFLRQDLLKEFVGVVVGQINGASTLHTFYQEKEYEMTFTGQVIYLEHYLNDLYDPINRDIYIEDFDGPETTYLFNKAENNEETYLFNKSENEPPTYLYNKAELQALQIDFVVFVPASVTFTEVVMRKQIDKYKLAGKAYKIEVY